MGQVVVETFVARSPDALFAYLTDYANEAKWQSHVDEARVEPPGPARVGTRVHKVRRTGGGRQQFITEVKAIDPAARQWKDEVVTGSFRGTTGEWSVTAAAGGSKVRLVATMRAPGLYRLLLPLITRMAGKDLRIEFANLKRLLEAPA
jgi:ribosome-associated toxin RatA of RatAB toxin-antitoxin module